MKVLLDQKGPLRGLKKHLEAQGDQLVTAESCTAELVVENPIELDPDLVGISRAIGDPTHTVTRWYTEGEFSQQTYVGIPLIGVMNDSNGAKVPVGLVGRYVRPELFSWLFQEDGLLSFLKELNYSGFITYKLAWNDVVGLQTGVPYWGIYGILEGVRGAKISDWLSRPFRLYETWTASVLVSRFPYPGKDTGERTSVGGLEGEHTWVLGGDEFKGVRMTGETEIAVVTWADGVINEMARGVRRVCQEIKIEGVQYRTDLADIARLRWSELRERAIV